MANRPPITSESEIQAHIRLALGRIPGLVLWRNSTGVAERNGRVQHFGLCKGSSDLIGIYATVILPEHVGMTIGRFVAGEVKTARGVTSDEQRMFLDLVAARGGLAGVWRSVEDALKTIGIPTKPEANHG